MALPLQTSTATTVDLPLACDPAMQAANPPREDGTSALALFRINSDPDGLVIPPDASIVTLRPLSRQQMRAADSAGGRYRDADFRAYMKVIERTEELARMGLELEAAIEAVDAHAQDPTCDAALQARKRVDDLLAVGADRPSAAALDVLDEVEYAAYHRHSEWMLKRDREQVRLGLVRLSDLPDIKAGPDGYPLAVIDAASDIAEDLIAEIALHVRGCSDVGKARRQSSGGSSGVTRGSAATTSAPTPKDEPATADGSVPTMATSSTASGSCPAAPTAKVCQVSPPIHASSETSSTAVPTAAGTSSG